MRPPAVKCAAFGVIRKAGIRRRYLPPHIRRVVRIGGITRNNAQIVHLPTTAACRTDLGFRRKVINL